MGSIARSKRQLAWVFDLNKCIGCQTCSVACKVLWTQEEEGAEHQWCSVPSSSWIQSILHATEQV